LIFRQVFGHLLYYLKLMKSLGEEVLWRICVMITKDRLMFTQQRVHGHVRLL
jgi:hypothetical protein